MAPANATFSRFWIAGANVQCVDHRFAHHRKLISVLLRKMAVDSIEHKISN